MRLASQILRSALLATTLALISASSSRGAVPSPATSTHDPCFVVCPLSDLSYHVTVRDAANIPVAGSTVVLDYSQCGFVHCQNPGLGVTANNALKTMTTTSNAAGVATFPLAMGGCCPAVKIFADGVLLATVSMASPDQDASLVVNGTDTAILTGLVSGPYNVCGDLDCNGSLGANDLGILQAHNGHTCDGVVPTQSRSWGRLKTFYR
ncbi:MAG TPA: hypothetical protein VI504_09710 [Candidatus Eisenbacteria bacterium]|jgi:hypothetical protein